MTNNVAIVTDSIANLPEQMVEQYKIRIVPVRLLVQGKVYRDGVDMSISEAYKMFLQDQKILKLHQPRPRIILKPTMKQVSKRRTFFVLLSHLS